MSTAVEKQLHLTLWKKTKTKYVRCKISPLRPDEMLSSAEFGQQASNLTHNF